MYPLLFSFYSGTQVARWQDTYVRILDQDGPTYMYEYQISFLLHLYANEWQFDWNRYFDRLLNGSFQNKTTRRRRKQRWRLLYS